MTEIARVKTVLTGFPGAPGVQTMYFRKRTGLGWDNYGSDLVNRMDDFWTTLGNVINTRTTWTVQSVIEIVDDATGVLQFTFSTGSPTGRGTGTNRQAPTPTGLLAEWLTNDVADGRHVKGKAYVVPVDLGTISIDGAPETAALQAVQNAAEGVIGSGGEAVVPVVWHRPKKDKVTKVITRVGGAYDVKYASVMTKFCVLRSRRD